MSDPKVEQAKQMADLGQFDEAMALLQLALQANPQDAEIHALLEEIQERAMLESQVQEKLVKVQDLIDKGDSDQARKILGEILHITPGHPEATILLRGLSSPAPVISDTYPGLPLQPLETAAPPAENAAGTADDAIFELPTPLEPEPVRTQPSSRPGAPATLERPGESATDQNFQLSPFGPQLGSEEMAKVQQYIQEGQAHFDQGRYQEAIDAWTRVFIIDENNQDAQLLIDKAKGSLTQHQAQVEHYLTEGIAAYNSGDSARCRDLMQQILAVFPGHREVAPVAPAPAAPKVAPPAPTGPRLQGGPAAPKEGLDEFELEDDLTVPTGPEMRSAPPANAEFQFESGGDELSFASVNPAASGASHAAAEDFTWEEPAAEAPAAPAPPPAAVAAAQAAPAAPASPEESEPVTLHRPAFEGATQEEPMPAQPATAGAEVGEEGEAPARRPMPGKRASRAPGVGVVAGIIVAMIVLGVGIFFGARFFLNKSGTTTTTTGPSTTPAKPVKPPGNKAPTTGEQPQPGQPGQPTQPAQPSQPNPAMSPEDEAKTMSAEQLLAKAREASAAKDYKTALLMYHEVLTRDSGNGAAIQGAEAAKAAQLKQDEEAARNEKFIKSYQSALASFQEQDYASCLGVAWRLIYPDDTLARQLGKRDAIAKLIRCGYYNWAVQDLKSENTREAESKLKDLLDFDHSDADAQKLYAFVKKYKTQGPDDTYRQSVKSLTYRTFSESP